MIKNYIGISRDHSGSMASIARAAARDYNANIATIRSAATNNNIETLVSVVECGFGRTNRVRREWINENVSALQPINENVYSAHGTGTPLFDSVGELIEIFEAVQNSTPKTTSTDPYTAMGREELRQEFRNAGVSYGKLNNEGMREKLRSLFLHKTDDVSFLVMVVTDGQENASIKWDAHSLAAKICNLQATDRWTFVFRVPRGYRLALARLGIPEGNILEWDQTERGVAAATVATEQAFTQYYSARSRGETMTKSFYTTDLSNVKSSTVKAKLVDISKDVQFFNVTDTDQIKPFIEQKTGRGYVAGTAFYQLTKKESEVQDYKQIALREKKSGKVYTGVEARNLLGLPHNGTVMVAPGNHGMYDLFIESTSVNRKLLPGTQVLYWASAKS